MKKLTIALLTVLALVACVKEKSENREVITITLPNSSSLPSGSSLTIYGIPGMPVEVIANGGDVFKVSPDETGTMFTPSEGSMVVGWWMAKGKTKNVKLCKDCTVLMKLRER